MTAPVKKIDLSPFTPLGRWLAGAIVPHVPTAISPNQVTVASFGAYLIAGVSFWRAGAEPAWYLVAAVCIFLHWFGDELDGALARFRQQSSERGFFLDVYLDAVGAAALCFGLAFSGTMPPLLPVALLTIFLIAVFLSSLHIVLRREFPMGRIGPSESQAFLLLLSVVSYVLSGPVVTVQGVALGWLGLGLAVSLPICALQLVIYSVIFYRQLDPDRASP